MGNLKHANEVSLNVRRILVRNSLLNILGLSLPLLAALLCTPLLINGLGLARFGVLLLSWGIAGYFTIFEMGVARALTKFISEKKATRYSSEEPLLIWTSVIMLSLLGVVGAFFFACFTPWVVNSVLNIPSELKKETIQAFYLLSFSVPIVTISSGLRGVLEAHQRFDLSNIVRIPLGISIFLGPACVLSISNRLGPIIAVLLLIRLLALCAYFYLCMHIVPELHAAKIKFDRNIILKFACFGGWVSISGVAGPLMVYMDRFLIGVSIDPVAVSYYVAPYEVATKLLIFPTAVMAVLFPAFSSFRQRDSERMQKMFNSTLNILIIVLIPLVLILNTFAFEGLSLWLGRKFADHSTIVFQLIAVGVLFNAMAQVPYGLIQGQGRPDLTAKLHVFELPIYLLILWILIKQYGIVGAASAWLIRAIFDMIGLFVLAQKCLALRNIFSCKRCIVVFWTLILVFSSMCFSEIRAKLIFTCLSLGAYSLSIWLSMRRSNKKCIVENNIL